MSWARLFSLTIPKRPPLAVGVGPIQMVVEGKVTDLGQRPGAAIGISSERVVYAGPEDTVLTERLDDAAHKMACELAALSIFGGSANIGSDRGLGLSTKT